ncbi:hypothetical protein D0865_04509 [Hortaea werneckii]|uniref:Uncharacterized protein n=1 Tax=Hortaea werneckii TaxID=91943 RepID=A0A3M7CT23_HORWE|nr:hypothetical protein D0865_04509 [Hortaea werneckii]
MAENISPLIDRLQGPEQEAAEKAAVANSAKKLRPAAASPVARPQAMGRQPESDPTPDTNVKKRHSIFGISGLLQAFSFEIEKSFLTPVERRILQHIHVVGFEGRFQSSGTLSEPARLFMPDEDSSEALQAIQALTRHYSIHDKEILCRDLDRLLTKEQRKMLRKTLYSDVEIRCQHSNRFVSPQAYRREETARLRVSQGPVRAVTFAEASQRPPPRNALHDATPPAGEIVIRHDIEISRDSSCLRGGGGKETRGTTLNISDLRRRPKPLKDDQRPHPAIWWLAGGRLNPRKPGLGVPTASTLRERRVVEDANRETVGFLGTLVGLRRVEVTRRQLREACKPLLTGHDDGTPANSGEAGKGAKEPAAGEAIEAPDSCGAAGSTEVGTQGKR